MKSFLNKIKGRGKSSALSTSGEVGAITEDQIKKVLSNVIDPDFKKDIVTLGFVRNLKIEHGKEGSDISFDINLTTPACPIKEKFREDATFQVKTIPGVKTVNIKMTADTVGSKTSGSSTGTALSGIKNIIAVASGKGGVGKSTTAVNLAYALKAAGSKVGILDADICGPSIPKMTGVLNPEEMDGNFVVPPSKDGISMISCSMFKKDGSANILRGPMAASMITQFLTQVKWGDLDYLIIDYPPGTSDIQLTLSQVCNITGAVLVTTPQEVATIDCEKAAQMFNTLNVPVIGIIETMSYFEPKEGEKYYIFGKGGARRVADKFGIPVLGEIPIEEDVTQTCDQGKALVTDKPTSKAAKAYTESAGSVARNLSVLHMENDMALESFSLKWRSK
ncbi:Mrp/NBP35 family ATP-binding protein [bacterium]|nr:Mrp/NBP35 family ATP-binding protein [bacterium]